jgi:hypothetical protein
MMQIRKIVARLHAVTLFLLIASSCMPIARAQSDSSASPDAQETSKADSVKIDQILQKAMDSQSSQTNKINVEVYTKSTFTGKEFLEKLKATGASIVTDFDFFVLVEADLDSIAKIRKLAEVSELASGEHDPNTTVCRVNPRVCGQLLLDPWSIKIDP